MEFPDGEGSTTFTLMGIDVWKVIAAASTIAFGFMPFYQFYPGPGLGGHCIPLCRSPARPSRPYRAKGRNA